MEVNLELSRIFYEIADLLEMMGVDWKPSAYRKAARVVEALPEDISAIYKKKGIAGFTELPGIGEGIAKKIVEFVEKGKITEYEKLKREIPEGVEELMHVQSLGPKKVWRLYKELGIKSLSGLKKACTAHKIRGLEGFGEKSEQDILRGLGFYSLTKNRMLLGYALPVARDFCKRLKHSGLVERAEVAGSLRRMKETIGDIDILAISSKPAKVMDFFTSMPEVKDVLVKGSSKSAVFLKTGVQADLRVLEKTSFGAALQYFTGSKEHNVRLRQLAIKQGLKLSEYGLFSGKELVAGSTEQEIYKRLGFKSTPPPEIRENQGEFESVPNLIKYNSLNGDLQMHTTWSDGVNSVEEMALACKKQGYDFCAITDHSKSEHIANGMPVARLKKYFSDIESVEKKLKFRVLKGIEVDVLPSGSLDYSDSVLKQFDFVLAAIHSRFKSSEKDMMKRISKALSNPYVHAFAHPTGRVIGQREGYAVDIEGLIDIAKENNVVLEINAFPERLDLRDVHIKKAVEKRCLLSIGTDSHSVDHLGFAELGVAQARRGWCAPELVVNTWKLSRLEKFLSSKR